MDKQEENFINKDFKLIQLRKCYFSCKVSTLQLKCTGFMCLNSISLKTILVFVHWLLMYKSVNRQFIENSQLRIQKRECNYVNARFRNLVNLCFLLSKWNIVTFKTNFDFILLILNFSKTKIILIEKFSI